MSREIECPSCGMRIPLDRPLISTDSGEIPAVSNLGRTVELLVPATVCHDEECRKQPDEDESSTSLPVAPGPFHPVVAGDGAVSLPADDVPSASHSSENGHDHSVSDPDLRVGSLPVAPFGVDHESSSSEDLRPAAPDPVLDAIHASSPEASVGTDPFLARFSSEGPSFSPSPGLVTEAVGGHSVSEPLKSDLPTPEDVNQEVEDVEYEEEGRSLGSILLTSYASALTIALVWLIWTGRVWQTPSGPPSIPSDSLESVESGAFLRNLPNLPVDHFATIGKPLRLGDLEITPVSVEGRPESLVGLDGKRSKAEKGTLRLTIRLRNLSADKKFRPIGPRFVRVPDRGAPETVLIAGDEAIFPYPLAMQSERSIVGQNFEDLAPGAEREQIIVSAPDAIDKLTPTMTWRIRVRTSPDQTDTIGIEFQKADVQL